MNAQAIDYYARKFFPHLTLECGRACIMAILISRGEVRLAP